MADFLPGRNLGGNGIRIVVLRSWVIEAITIIGGI